MDRTASPAHGLPQVAGVLLAAGGGRRLGGRPKALLPYRGRPLVEHAVRVLREGGCARVHVVLGAAADEVRARAVFPGAGVVLHHNPDWTEGMGSSLRTGLRALQDGDGDGDRNGTVDAALVSLVDQPGIGAAAVARVVRAAARERGEDGGVREALVAAAYGGRRGHPVLFGAARWDGVAASAEGDRGARRYLREHASTLTLVECGGIADPSDIDTPDDLPLLER